MDRDATLYDRDFYAWTQEQAAVLREAGASGTNLPVDWENLAEEIESMGRRDLRGAASHLARVIEHLLKLEYSPATDPQIGWEESVTNHRIDARGILDDSPSLRCKLPDALPACYADGRKLAAKGLKADVAVSPSDLPPECPYTLDQLLDDDFWPANRHGLT